ncbi:MAG: hypothetical protein KatS3mg035_0109 [Bacteroidia bacterium]|nr:MAG: hypothetical protein KatS3mg035_0109 [Bacteroidia bacterium]
MKSISIVLKRIECIKTNETGSDELFVQIHAKENVKKGVDFITTCPKNQQGYWSIKSGDVLDLNEILFVDKIENGLSVEVSFIEEDVTGLLVHKAIQELIDDYIGAVSVVANKDGQKHIQAERNTKLKEQNNNNYVFSLAGSGSHYLVTLEIE